MSRKANIRKAKSLGAAYKKGYPATYLKNQTKPRYRKTRSAQNKEVERLSATAGLPRPFAINILKNKYKKSETKWLIRK